MGRIKRAFRFNFTYVGGFVGVLFALLSLTPSLLPRGWFFQGVLVGIALVFGYGIGNAIGAIYRYFELPEPSAKNKRVIKKSSYVVAAMLGVYMLIMKVEWNNELLEGMGLEPNNQIDALRIILVAAIISYLILVGSRMIRGAVRVVKRWVLRILPRKLAVVVGSVLGIIIVVFLINGVLLEGVRVVVNQGFSTRDGTTDEGIFQPESPLRSGGPESLVSWESLGRQGRKFTGGGPTVADINEFTGGGAMQPIRVYAGLKSADTIQERADLVLEELKRTNAFERDVLVLATTTGTGWLDPGAVDTVEYVNGGNTAIAGIQYSYLPSWISLFVDQQITKDTALATLNTVHDYWSELPRDERPELFLFGLSLGAFGSIDSATSLRLVNDPIDGSLWAGPPFVSPQWNTLTDRRDEGSPYWKPVVDDGRVVRFTNAEVMLDDENSEWGHVKYSILQQPNDPIVFFSPDLLFRSPEWLEGERGPGVTDNMNWYPGVTFWQVAVDLPAAGAVPGGNGHAYSPSSYIDVWAAVTEPAGWNAEKAGQLKQILAD